MLAQGPGVEEPGPARVDQPVADDGLDLLAVAWDALDGSARLVSASCGVEDHQLAHPPHAVVAGDDRHDLRRVPGDGPGVEEGVCYCIECNNKKGNRTPEHVGMQLLRQPHVPSRITFIQHFIGIADSRWRPYLFLS